MKRKIKNRKLKSGIKTGLMALIVLTTVGLVTSCHSNDMKFTRIECTNDGEFTESVFFVSPEDHKDYKTANEFKYYNGWFKGTDGYYSCQVDVYNAEGKTYEDIKPLVNNEKIVDDVLGEPLYFYEEKKPSLSKYDLERGSYFRAVIYEEEKTDKKEESDKNYAPLFIGLGTASIGTVSLIAWKKYNDKLEEKKKLTLKK